MIGGLLQAIVLLLKEIWCIMNKQNTLELITILFMKKVTEYIQLEQLEDQVADFFTKGAKKAVLQLLYKRGIVDIGRIETHTQ